MAYLPGGRRQRERREQRERENREKYERKGWRVVGWFLLASGAGCMLLEMAIAAIACGTLGLCLLAACGEPEPGEDVDGL